MTPVNHRAASAYRNVGIQTSSAPHDQHQLVTLMLQTVLENIAQAQGAIEREQTEQKIQALGKAIRIVQEGLRTSLDMDNGGQLAANLAALYDYVALRLTQGNLRNDVLALQEAASLLKPVLEAWMQIRASQSEPVIEQAKASTAAPAAGNPKPTSGANTQRSMSFYGAGVSHFSTAGA